MKTKSLLMLAAWWLLLLWIHLSICQGQTVAGYSLSYDTNSTVTVTNHYLTFTNDLRRSTDGTNANSTVRYAQVTNITTRLSDIEGRTNQWNAAITNAQGTNGVSASISNNILTVDGAGTITNVVSTGGGTSIVNQVTGQRALIKSLKPGANMTITDDGTNVTLATGAGVGEANTASTSGPGFPLTLAKVGIDLPFRGVSNQNNGLTISTNADSLILGVDSVIVVTNAANIGTGTNVFAGRSGGTLQFKRLLPGGSVALADDGSNITISATVSGEANTATNVGIGHGWFFEKVGVDLRFRAATSSGPISISLGGNTNIILGFDGSVVHNASGATNIPSSAIVGLGTMAYQNSNAVLIVGGLIRNTDFTNGALNTISRSLINGSGQTNYNWDANEIFSLGVSSARFGTRRLHDSSGLQTLNWESSVLTDAGGSTSVYWLGRILANAGGDTSLDWSNRILYAVGGTTEVLNWKNKTLSGLWTNLGSLVVTGNISADNIITKQTTSLPVWLHVNPEQNKDSGSGNTNAVVADFDIGSTNVILGFASTNGAAQQDFIRFAEATVPVGLTSFANPAMTFRVFGTVTGAATNKVDVTIRDLVNNSIYVTNALTTSTAGGLTAVTVPNTGMFSSNLAGHALLFQITGYSAFTTTSGVDRVIQMSGQ